MKKAELQAMYPRLKVYWNWEHVPKNLYTETKLKKEKIISNLFGFGEAHVAVFASRVRSDAFYFLYDKEIILKIQKQQLQAEQDDDVFKQLSLFNEDTKNPDPLLA